MEQAGVQLIAQGANVYIGDLKSATNATNTFVDATDKGSGRVTAAGQVMIGGLRKVGEFTVNAMAQALKATASFVTGSIDLAGDFDQTMSVLQATSKATAEEMGAVSAKAKALGSDLTLPATSAVDAGEAMLELSKAGFSVQESMDAAKGVLQLAAAAQIDEARAAEINANALNAFQLEAKDSIFVSDLLAASASESSIEITDVAQSYQMAGAIFSAFQGPVVGAKESLVQLTTAIGILGNAGIKGSDAGTALKQSLLQLTGPSQKAKEEMRALFLATQAEGDAGQNLSLVLQGNAAARAEGLRGLQESAGATAALGDIAYDAAGNMRPFPEILRLTSLATKGMTAELRDNAITTIFGADAARAILVLMQKGPAAWDDMTAAVTRQGAAQDLAAAQTKGWNGALEGAKSQLETLQLTIGQKLTPVLADLLNTYVSPGIATLTDMADAIFGNDEAFARLSPTMQGIVSVIDVVIADIQEIIGAFDEAGSMSSEFGESIGQLAGDLGLPGELIQDIVFAVQDLVGWFSTASDESSDLGNAVDDLSDIWVRSRQVADNEIAGYMAIAQAVLPVITQFVADHGEEISAFFQESWNSIIQIVNLALDVYDAIVPPVLQAIAGFISDHGSEITKVLSGAWEMISALITGTLETIKGVFKVTLAVISGDWEGAWTGVKGIAEAQATAIGGIVTGFLDLIAGFFDTSMAEIGQTWEDNWNMLVNIALNMDWAQVGQNAVDGILSGLRGAWGSLVGWITDKMSGLVDAALSAIDAKSPAVAFMPIGQFSVQGIMAGFESMWPELTALVADMGDDLADQARDIADSVQSAIADAFGATASIDRQKVSNLRDVGKLDEKRRAGVQSQIDAAEKIALAMNDPVEAARYFKMRSEQLIELGELGDKINGETDRAKRAALQVEYDLINAAQQAEMKQFEAQQTATKNTTESLAQQINDLIGAFAGLKLTDNQIHAIDALAGMLASLGGIPHRAGGGPVDAFQPYWVGEKGPELFWPTTAGRISPAASSQQMAGRANTTNYYGNVGPQFGMQVYTNNTPGAIQQSWAIMQASMT